MCSRTSMYKRYCIGQFFLAGIVPYSLEAKNLREELYICIRNHKINL